MYYNLHDKITKNHMSSHHNSYKYNSLVVVIDV